MLIIGERINATRKRIREAVLDRDAELIRVEARRQVAAGAQMLDCNGGVEGREPECLAWLVTIVQEAVDVPLCLDSADPEALARALPLCRRRPLINSVTDERARLAAVLPLVREHGADVVALCMSEAGTPRGVDDRVATAGRLIEAIAGYGIEPGKIWIDPCVFPISTGAEHGPAVLGAVRRIREIHPGAHTTAGVSNVSFGLPVRKLLNKTFLTMLIGCGLEAAIVDPTEEGLVAGIHAAEALAGRDDYCVAYLEAYRDGTLGAPTAALQAGAAR
jgi:5-methyltetrahydrofolate--homocysteine methyltransferase